jgi:uncharacterized protein YbcV (DUF1398 family)
MPMQNKGIATTIGQMFGSLFVIGLVALAFVILFQTFTEVNLKVHEATNKRHTIVLANVFLSTSDFTYSGTPDDGKAVLNSFHLDSKFIKTEDLDLLDSASFLAKSTEVFSNNEFFDKYSYPDEIYTVKVEDLETGEKWIGFGHGPFSKSELNPVGYLTCIWHQYTERLEIPSINDLLECASETASEIVPSTLTFPVDINSFGEMHMGRMSFLTVGV